MNRKAGCEVALVLARNYNESRLISDPDPNIKGGYESAFIVPVWHSRGKTYALFGISEQGEIHPLGGKRERGENQSQMTAFREFIEETFNMTPSSNFVTGVLKLFAHNYYIKKLNDRQVYYVVDADIMAQAPFSGMKVQFPSGFLDMSPLINNGTIDMKQLILKRPIILPNVKAHGGLNEIKYLVGVDIILLRDQILQKHNRGESLSGFKFYNHVVRRDLREVIAGGLFKHF